MALKRDCSCLAGKRTSPAMLQKLAGWQAEVTPAKGYKQEGNNKVVVPDH